MASKVKVPPLVLAAAAAGVQQLISKPEVSPRPVRAVAAGALGVASAALAASSVRAFRRSQTTVNPMSPERATSLVTDGPHRISRNPMYVGMAGLLAAHAMARGKWAATLPVMGFFAVMDRVQIHEEEAALTKQFGAAYTEYAEQVPRWLAIPTQMRN